MRALHAIAVLVLTGHGAAALEGGPVVGGSDAAVARAAIDPNLFRDGEVRRRNERHGRWSLDCDEVPRLGQRYCSLRSLALEATGAAAARVTISTDEGGRPAALLDLPLPLDLREPVTVTAATGLLVGKPSRTLFDDAHKRATGASPTTVKGGGGKLRTMDVLSASLRPDICGPSSCHAVWQLAPSDVAALRAGAGLRIRFKTAGASLRHFTMGDPGSTRLVEAIVSSDGLDAAIMASLHN